MLDLDNSILLTNEIKELLKLERTDLYDPNKTKSIKQQLDTLLKTQLDTIQKDNENYSEYKKFIKFIHYDFYDIIKLLSSSELDVLGNESNKQIIDLVKIYSYIQTPNNRQTYIQTINLIRSKRKFLSEVPENLKTLFRINQKELSNQKALKDKHNALSILLDFEINKWESKLKEIETIKQKEDAKGEYYNKEKQCIESLGNPVKIVKLKKKWDELFLIFQYYCDLQRLVIHDFFDLIDILKSHSRYILGEESHKEIINLLNIYFYIQKSLNKTIWTNELARLRGKKYKEQQLNFETTINKKEDEFNTINNAYLKLIEKENNSDSTGSKNKTSTRESKITLQRLKELIEFRDKNPQYSSKQQITEFIRSRNINITYQAFLSFFNNLKPFLIQNSREGQSIITPTDVYKNLTENNLKESWLDRNNNKKK